MSTHSQGDDSVVVIIGSGAGGGTLANELCKRGAKVVLLEAGKRESPATFINDEWASFGQLAWLDKRTTSGTWRVAKDFSGLPAWICKTVGGTTTHWAGASLRIHDHEFRARTVYGEIKGANLLDWPVMLWPPPFTAVSRLCARAKLTALATSAVFAQRAMSAG